MNSDERINLIRTASLDCLQDAEWLEYELLPTLGLNVDFPLYPERLHRFNGGLASWQYPRQFAPYLVWLSDQDIHSYLEIGVHHGGTFIITVEYLRRFGRVDSAVAIDVVRHPLMAAYCADNGFEFYQLDSQEQNARRVLDGRQFDLAFIDGDHSFEGFHNDWNLVNGKARIIACHDVTNRGYPWIQQFYDDWPGAKHGYFEQYDGIDGRHLPQYGIGVFRP